MTLSIPQKIIQILLSENGAIKKQELVKNISINMEELGSNLEATRDLLLPLQLKLVESNSSLQVSLSSEINEYLQKQKIDNLKQDLSESALETISVILFKPGSTKAEIDFVRGVDSTRSLKNLQLRGLIEKNESRSKKTYHLTTDTLTFLGLSSETETQDFEEINMKLRGLLSQE